MKGGLPRPIVMLPSNRQGDLIRSEGLDPLGVPQALARCGASVVFLDVHGFPLNPLAGRPSLFASIDPWRAFKILFAYRKAGIVLSYYQSGVLLILALRRILRFKPAVVIVDIGDDTGWRIRARIVKFCIRRADAVFTFSRWQAKYLRRKYRVKNTHFLPQQVDTRFFFPQHSKKDYLLAVGGDISRDYGLLREHIYPLGEPMILRTGCVGPEPLFPHVRVIQEYLKEAQLRALYQEARLMLLPLHDMGHPGGITTLLEAFACGCAVVASCSRGIADYLRPGENCLAVPCGDGQAFRTAVERLLQDTALRHRLGAAARRFAETELSQDHHAARLLQRLSSLRDQG